ncbi:MAG: TRZ/ATZ family hydrolase [Gammaproteobacteria bacterium]|nr:TRZ/ATZ family hydrolase [Gammaproteobacteria bacterium]NND40366.1 TRZ/ATZ family hydrolase [Pseudomonadales bacterium]MBT8151082.1 TRZ/ATZ family hydrolase [Gammaproteobacteria bacterium]NNL11965.1 TRZ/ATZ family hydrolase [Pseudomonadales bacterium]NNM12571.1 TRZ/ATZ family hydrolase [Pseudomonadales bacterium]
MSGANGEALVLRNYGLRFEAGLIREIAPYNELAEAGAAADIPCEFLDGHILLPGLVNCHGHAGMSLLRGYADDLPLQDWLEQHIWPLEGALVNAEFVEHGSQLAIAEMLQSGTTTFSDMYFFPDVLADAAVAAGMRAQITFPVLEFASAWANNAEEYLSKGLALMDAQRHNELLRIGFGTHAPYTVSDQTFQRVAVLAAEVDAPIQVHLQETAAEITQSKAEHGCSPVERLQRLGVLGPRAQAVHMVHFDASDLLILSESGTSVVHCPASNAKLASGYSNISQLIAAGLAVGLGTDSAASNNTLDLFDTARLAALLAKQQGDASALPAWQCLHMATRGGAEVLGMGAQIGSLEVGKCADFIAVDTRNVAMQPLYEPASQLIYTAAGNAVTHSWIGGRCVLRERRLQSIDNNALLEQNATWRERILQWRARQ